MLKARTLLCLAFTLSLAINFSGSHALAQSAPSSAESKSAIVVDTGTTHLDVTQLQNASSLKVAAGATAVIDFSAYSNLSLAGDITNSGSIFAFSSNPNVSGANFGANNIFNIQGGLFSTVLPTTLTGGLNALPQFNLSLSAINQIVNAGTISSSGSLNLSAGAEIINTGVMSAAQNVSVMSQLGNIVNSGVISAVAGNVNISTLASQNLLVNNINGLVESVLGNINFSVPSSLDKINMSVLGGDFVAKELNFSAPNGIVDVNTGRLDGLVNIDSCGAHVTASTDNLQLGQMNILGDPTFYNTGGDLTINSNLDFAPVQFKSSPVALAILASGNITAANGVTTISTNTTQTGAPNNWPGSNPAGSIWIIAGVNFSAAPTDGSPVSTTSASPPTPPPGDTAETLTINSTAAFRAASSTGGSINLSGVNINTQAGIPSTSTQSGDVLLAAFKVNANTGNITVGNISTGEVGAPANDNTGLNGSVAVLAEGDITIGGVSTAGNTINPALNNGNIILSSANLLTMVSPQGGNSWIPSLTTLQSPTLYAGVTNTAGSPGVNQITVSSTSGIAANTVLYLDPHGPNAEVVTVSSISSTGNVLTLSAPLAKYHSATETVYVGSTSITINPGAGNPGSVPLAQAGAIFAPDRSNVQSGTITISGNLAGTGAITVLTGGIVNAQGSMSLSANPTNYSPLASAPNFNRLPTISITGNTVNVSSGQTISSAITGCGLCPSSTVITTSTLVNNGTIGTAASGTPANDANLYVLVKSTGGLSVSGTGSFQVPNASVIELAAADTTSSTGENRLSLGSMAYTAGTDSLVLLNAQGSNSTTSGIVAIGGAQTFTGAPTVIVNAPRVSLTSSASFSGASAGAALLFTSGYTSDDLKVQVIRNVKLDMPTTFYPAAGKNLEFRGAGNLSLPQAALLSVSGAGTITIPAQLNIIGTKVYTSQNPSGNIHGYAFQPYVGGQLNPGSPASPFVQFAAYPYWSVISLLGNTLSTRDTTTGLVTPQIKYVSTYTQLYSSGYVIEAAKQVGLGVSAGVFALINVDGSMDMANYNVANFDINYALSSAALHGNVIDVVVGNENIVGGATPGPSITTLQSLIAGGNITVNGATTNPVVYGGAQALRTSTVNPLTGANYSSSTLPVTTRQQSGVLNLVATQSTMVSLMQACEQYVYGNFYPFFDESGVVPNLTPSLTKDQFSTLVKDSITGMFNTNANNFNTNVTTKAPLIRVGETGWATPLQGYAGVGLPQQNLTWAQWYYAAMQDWSLTYNNPQTGASKGAIISAYFEAYNEPWKGVVGGNPNGQAASLNQAASPGDTTITALNNAPFFNPTLTPQSIVIDPGNSVQEIQNYFGSSAPAGNVLNLSSTNFPGAIVNAHSVGASIVAATPQEPFFGILVAQGNALPAGALYQLTGVTQQYSIAPSKATIYVPPTMPSVSAAPPAPTVQAPTLNLDLIASSALSLGNGLNNLTIIPTDVNPEIQPESNQTGVPLQDGGIQGLANNSNINLLPNPEGNLVSLPSGNAFLLPDHDIQVQTPNSVVKVAAGAAVMIFQTDNGISVFNLHDEKAGDVAITVGDETQEIGVGRQLTVSTKQDGAPSDSVPGSVGHRNSAHGQMSSKSAISSEFSLASALSNFSGLRRLRTSSDPEERRKADKILKTAAALSLLNKSKGAFAPLKE